MSENTGLKALTATDDFSMWEAVGGFRGIVEAIVPFLTFIIAFQLSSQLGLSLTIVAVGIVLFIGARLIQKQTIVGALSGMIVTIISVVLAALRGSARDFYSPGIWINAIFLIVLFVSVLLGKPGIGWLMDAWSSRKTMQILRREYAWATWVWIAGFAMRLGAEIPLYITHNVSALGIVRIVTGIPLFAVMLLISWAIIAPARKKKLSEITEEAHSSHNLD